MKQETPRNYEYRNIPGVGTDVTVNRDGNVQIKGRDYFDANLTGITALDGTRMSVRMCIVAAFPDIPMREDYSTR